MPGVDYQPDPAVDQVAPDHRDEGRVGNIRTIAQIEADAKDDLQRDREAGKYDPTGNPGPKVVDTDPKAGPEVRPGGARVLDYVPDLEHEIDVLDRERAAIEGRLAEMRRRQQDLQHQPPQTSAEAAARAQPGEPQTEEQRADERIRERAADERGGPSVFPDRTRSAEEQATARRDESQGLVPDRPRNAEEQTPAGRAAHPERERQEREPAEQHSRAAPKAGKSEVSGSAGPRGRGDAGKK